MAGQQGRVATLLPSRPVGSTTGVAFPCRTNVGERERESARARERERERARARARARAREEENKGAREERGSAGGIERWGAATHGVCIKEGVCNRVLLVRHLRHLHRLPTRPLRAAVVVRPEQLHDTARRTQHAAHRTLTAPRARPGVARWCNTVAAPHPTQPARLCPTPRAPHTNMALGTAAVRYDSSKRAQ